MISRYTDTVRRKSRWTWYEFFPSERSWHKRYALQLFCGGACVWLTIESNNNSEVSPQVQMIEVQEVEILRTEANEQLGDNLLRLDSQESQESEEDDKCRKANIVSKVKNALFFASGG